MKIGMKDNMLLNAHLNEFLNEGRESRVRNFGIVPGPAVVCKDGYSVSVQCSATAYSEPRDILIDADGYVSFELGYPSEHDDLIEEFAEMDNDQTNTIFPYVDRDVVLALLANHGGIEGTED